MNAKEIEFKTFDYTKHDFALSDYTVYFLEIVTQRDGKQVSHFTFRKCP